MMFRKEFDGRKYRPKKARNTERWKHGNMDR
jgi:hypothetical protein